MKKLKKILVIALLNFLFIGNAIAPVATVFAQTSNDGVEIRLPDEDDQKRLQTLKETANKNLNELEAAKKTVAVYEKALDELRSNLEDAERSKVLAYEHKDNALYDVMISQITGYKAQIQKMEALLESQKLHVANLEQIWKDSEAKVLELSTGYREEAPRTLIPRANMSQEDCFNLLYVLQLSSSYDLKSLNQAVLQNANYYIEKTAAGEDGTVSTGQILGCAIKTGMIKVWMLPLLVLYLINFMLGAAGIISVLFLVIGGYIYMFGGLSDDKDRGKKAILYGIVGFAVSLLAWVIVNTVQILATG